jgi:hypothetical protein
MYCKTLLETYKKPLGEILLEKMAGERTGRARSMRTPGVEEGFA